jgi:penicillin-binding protein 1A
MAMAYTTLASGGERLSSEVVFDPSQAGYPITIVRVTDSVGNVLDADTVVRTRVLDEDLAAMVTECLTQVIASGTGTAADIGRPAAGKTGTTQNYSDAWFVGYTPDLVTAVWVGYPSGQKPMTDVHGVNVTGGSLPAQIWASFMARALADTPVSLFSSVSANGWVSVEVCSESRLLPAQYCPELTTMSFREDLRPTDTCTVHAPKEIAVPDVLGLSLEKASAALQEAHFVVVSEDDASSLELAGTVVGQRPKAGNPLLQGSVVTLVVSTGEAIATVPALVGLDVAAARAELAADGLMVSEYTVTDDVPAGTVISQDPAPGSTVPVGWQVTLYISTGPTEVTSP